MMKKHLIYINLDGFGRYYYDRMRDEQKALPNIRKLVKRGVFFEQAYTGIPSITCPMQTGIVSGCYSDRTGNCDKYWDREANEIVLTGRLNRAQTIGEVLAEEGRTFVSIQQFALEGKGAVRGRKDRLYMEPGGDCRKRFSVLLKLIRENVIEHEGTIYEYPEFPDAVFLYIDDLDSVGHNSPWCYADSEEKRVDNVCRVLEGIDELIGETLKSLEEKGLLDSTYLLLTTDHGMVSYRWKSRTEDLICALKEWGYRVAVCREGNVETKDFDILLTSHDIQCQMFLAKGADNLNVMESLKKRLSGLPYVETVLTAQELTERGVYRDYADLLISPAEGESFSLIPLDQKHLYATHDSLHEKCQHIFTAVTGPGIRSDYRETSLVYNKDLIPTLAYCLEWKQPRDATGRRLTSILREEGKG